jgi:hypothetical protein
MEWMKIQKGKRKTKRREESKKMASAGENRKERRGRGTEQGGRERAVHDSG